MDDEEDVEELLDEFTDREPRIDSNDPNERKMARRLRIQRRIEAIKKQAQADDNAEEEESADVTNEVQQQILKSYELLEKYIQQGDEYISNVRIASDTREVDRREKEGLGRDKTIKAIEEEAQLAEEKFDEIAEKWSGILQNKDPLHIHDDMQLQKESCDELIAQKNEIIAMLKAELKTAERNFITDQRKQSADIEELSRRIEKQVIFMRKAYNNELEIIENVMLKERQELLDQANKRWEELYRQRDEAEEHSSALKFEHQENYYEQLNKLRVDFQENFRETKIKMENNIEELQRELEEIKALALLNNEKLDYNYQILKKREEENIIIKSQQKRKINKLKDFIINLRKKNANYKMTSLNQIKKLESDIKKLNKSILDVETKADHFATINDRKFHQILQLNIKEVEKILERIQAVDKNLHEQQMGVPWQPFDIHVQFNALLKLQYRAKHEQHTDVVSVAETDLVSEFEMTLKDSPDVLKKLPLQDSPAYCRLVKQVLNKIADKTDFLAEERLKELLAPYENKDKTIIRLDNTFTALSITEKSDIDILVQFFLPYAYCPVCSGEMTFRHRSAQSAESVRSYISKVTGYSYLAAKETLGANTDISMIAYQRATENAEVILSNAIEQPEIVYVENIGECTDYEELEIHSDYTRGVDDISVTEVVRYKDALAPKESNLQSAKATECQMYHPLEINSVHVLSGLRDFVTAHYSSPQSHQKSIMDRLNYRRGTISRMLPEQAMKKFWEKYKMTFSEDRKNLWEALLTGLKKYHDILKDRKMLSEEVVQLRVQNAELKQILSNYMYHGKAMDPPCSGLEFSRRQKTPCIQKPL